MRRAIFAVLAALSVSACGSNGSEPKNIALGTFNLYAVAGSVLPFALPATGTTTHSLKAAKIVISGNGTYTYDNTIASKEAGQIDPVDAVESHPGTWTRSGLTISMTETATSTVTQGTLTSSGLSLVIDMGGNAYTFSKQQ